MHDIPEGCVPYLERDYIARQEERHRVRTFREELVEFLEKSGVEYAPEHLD